MFRSTTVWRTAGDYELALDPWAGPKPVLRCRRAAGREVKKVPAALKDDPVVRELTALAEWIGDHAARALSCVESWMTQSLPVPAALIREVWPDPYWRRALRYAVIAPSDGSGGGIDVARSGVLVGVGARAGGALVVRGLDGAERELGDDVVVIPHPVLLDPRGSGLLERWRDVLGPLGGEQGIEQLSRAVYVRPDCSPAPGALTTHQEMAVFQGVVHESGARFEALVRRFGGRIGGERAGFSFGHQGRSYGMVAELRHQGPAAPVTLHGFRFPDCAGRHGSGAYDTVPRPVWSEGIRAVASLYDGRDAPVSGPVGSLPDDAGSAYQAFLVACAEYAAAGAPEAGPAKPRRAAGASELLDAGAVLTGEAGPGEEVLTARRHGSSLFEDGGCFVRLVVARALEAEDAVARALGLVPEAGGAVPVGRVPVRPLDLLSRVCGAHPELAREAMGLLAPLRACARTAETKPGRAATDLRSSLEKLTAPHPELLPYALDEGARILAAAGSVAMARPLYAGARAAEQRLGGVDEGALRALVSEFRRLGVVDEKLLGKYGPSSRPVRRRVRRTRAGACSCSSGFARRAVPPPPPSGTGSRTFGGGRSRGRSPGSWRRGSPDRWRPTTPTPRSRGPQGEGAADTGEGAQGRTPGGREVGHAVLRSWAGETIQRRRAGRGDTHAARRDSRAWASHGRPRTGSTRPGARGVSGGGPCRHSDTDRIFSQTARPLPPPVSVRPRPRPSPRRAHGPAVRQRQEGPCLRRDSLPQQLARVAHRQDADQPTGAQALQEGGEPLRRGDETGFRGRGDRQAEEVRDLADPVGPCPREFLPQLGVEDRAGPQLAPRRAVLPHLGHFLELEEQPPLQLLQRRPGLAGVGGIAAGVPLRAGADELQRAAQQTRAVLEVVVDERLGDTRLGGQLVDPEPAHATACDHQGGRLQDGPSPVLHPALLLSGSRATRPGLSVD